MTRLTRSAALGLTIAALASSPAFADPYASDPNYPLEDTSGYQDLRSPDARDAATGRGTFNAPRGHGRAGADPDPAAAAAGGIDWADAAIGAAGVLGLGLVAFGGGIAGRY